VRRYTREASNSADGNTNSDLETSLQSGLIQ
jgi:hypothetical protein